MASGQLLGLFSWLVGALGLVLGVAIVFGLIFGLVSKLEINPAEALRWSWRKARTSCQRGLVWGLLFGVAIVPISRTHEAQSVLVGSVVFGPIFAVLFGLIGGSVGGFTTEQLVAPASPNEGIRRLLANAVVSSLSGGLALGLLFWLVLALATAEPFSALGTGLQLGLITGGLFLALRYGGFAVIKHYVLRLLLWRNDYAPLNYVRFLDYAAERLFLLKVGGGYIFTHRLLMEYFASLQPPQRGSASRHSVAASEA